MQSDFVKFLRESYSIKSKRKCANQKIISYYRQSLSGKKDLWAALYADIPVGRRIYKRITKYITETSSVCGYCQDTIFHGKNSNVDHIIPASIYPQFTFFEENLVRSCLTCNMLKLSSDFYSPLANNNQSLNYPNLWSCYHPRHHVFSDHIERFVFQTNRLNIRVYLCKTTEGKVLCDNLLSKVSEFSVKANSNTEVSNALSNLSQFISANGGNYSASAERLIKALVKNI